MLPTASHGRTSDPSVSLDYGLDLFDDKRFQNTETALLDLLKSTSFRRLDNSQRALAYSHIAYSKINRGKSKESLVYIDKALAATEQELGKKSLAYVGHLHTKAVALYWSKNQRKAVRIGESMLKILDRMNGDYQSEQQRVKHVVRRMKASNLVKEELPLDLSDFYTACESITDTNHLPKAGRMMTKYKLIGKDIRPKHKKAQYFKNTYIKNARESSKDRKTRLIYVPDDKHMDDWCVIYPDGVAIDRVIISPSNER